MKTESQHLSQRQLFLSHVAQTTDFPLSLEIERAKGVYLYGKKGEKYIDFISGIGVSNIGHCHPKVVEAIQNQAEKFMHLMVYGEYIYSPQVLLTQKLTSLLPSKLDNVYLVNSGAEATEGAIKLAKRFTGRSEIISCHHSYHGSTNGALSLMGNEFYKQAYRPLLPDIQFITFGSWSDIEKISTKTACVIMETVQGEAGIRIACKEYYKLLRQKCDETGTILILDEIQTGVGRTGKMWAFEHYDIVPDVLLLAKGLGGGMPIGAFVANKEVMAVFKNNPILGHITTFGGHPVSCAAALATLDVVDTEKLYQEAEQKASLIKKNLKSDKIVEIRNLGLMMAVEFESFEVLKPIIDHAMENGVITDWFLHCNNAMRIAPPLNITEEEIKEACAIINKSMERE